MGFLSSDNERSLRIGKVLLFAASVGGTSAISKSAWQVMSFWDNDLEMLASEARPFERDTSRRGRQDGSSSARLKRNLDGSIWIAMSGTGRL